MGALWSSWLHVVHIPPAGITPRPFFTDDKSASIPFASLGQEVVLLVVDKFIMQLEAQLQDRNVTFDLSDDARAWLARKGYDEAYGARPLARKPGGPVRRPDSGYG